LPAASRSDPPRQIEQKQFMTQSDRAAPGLTIIGDIGIDLILGPVDGWPAIGTEILMERSEMRAGGSAGNTALAMRYLGARCRLLSEVGNDSFGGWLAQQFADVSADLHVCDAATSISTGIIHECGERTFFTTRGHLEQLCWQDIGRQVGPAPYAGAIALLTGVFLLPRMRAVYDEIIGTLHGLGYQVALDTGWPSDGWAEATRSEVLGWVAACDHILLNEIEVTALAGEKDLDRAMQRLAPALRPNATLVAKTGPKGAVGLQAGNRVTSAAPLVQPFDTIGAGDSFNAGYLDARLRGASLGDALGAGCRTAARVIARFPRQAIAHGEFADRTMAES
jgi:sugar/nucleoside kinase (ribokinase family)